MGKTCFRCKKHFEPEEEFFHKGKKGKRKGTCKFCINEDQKRASSLRCENKEIDDRAKYGWKWGE